MKLKSVFTTILSLMALTSCPGRGNSAFLLPIGRPGEFRLVYEPEFAIGREIPESTRKEWRNPEVKLRSADGIACLSAGSEFVYALSVCFPDRNGDINLEIQNIIKFWNENPEGRTESEELSFSELGTGRLKVELNRDLLEDCGDDWLILSGELSLDRSLKKISFPASNLVSVFSENSSVRPHSPGAFTGFSVFANSERMKIVFHSKNRIRASNSLILEIPGNASVLSDFVSEIQRKNSEVLSRCKDGIPELSEVFGGTNSPTGRFLEFQNSSFETICFQDLNLDVESKLFSVEKGKAFLIPGETILRVETGSILPGNEIPGFPWSELKKKGEWFLKTSSGQVAISNRALSFQEGERFYSSSGNFYSLCNRDGLFESSDRLCMNPGISENFYETEGLYFCNVDDFQIEEANFTGLFLNGKVDGKQKFLDLEYSGNRICNPNVLSLAVGDKEYPIWLDSESISANGILTLGKRDWLEKGILLSDNELSDSEFGERIFLKDRLFQKERNLSQEMIADPILKKNDGLLLSLLFRNGTWIPHPIRKSETLLEPIREIHSMNPGLRSELREFDPNSSAELSEVSWMGSYDGATAISGDRFVELDSLQSTSKILEIHSGTKNYRFLVSLEAGKNVFSSSRLVCFPNVNAWVLPELALTSSGEIRILSLEGNSVVDSFVWNSQGPGFNSPALKSRRSASKFRTLGGSVVWKNSALSNLEQRKSTCSQTEASPGFINRTFPFFWKESATSNSLLDPLLSWNLPKIAGVVSGEIQVFAYQPAFSGNKVSEGFFNLWSQIQVNTFNNWNIQKNALNYLISVGGESLVLIPGASSILISAIYPSPALSTNEWFSICNRGFDPVDVRSLEIRDSSAADRLVEYSARFGTSRPIGWDTYNSGAYGWVFDDRFLIPGECGYVLSPNFKNESVPFHDEHRRKIFTIEKTTTIGNGIAKNEGLDLFQEIQQTLVHVHSYGNQYSPFPFAYDSETGDLILLLENRSGDSILDYEIRKKDLP
ncbi:LIC11755 family lipoprotein [Leptospira adleri]|uniref:LIC11755 family lipoprotein n=1 Tax=Leptospira adleri TaxID=2023186 RepID=UPI0010827C32|nr:hypothetical protein [Leptospira adleri]TGM59931.1 hypothetical protein EHQ97_04530 [Leptospira adleri]